MHRVGETELNGTTISSIASGAPIVHPPGWRRAFLTMLGVLPAVALALFGWREAHQAYHDAAEAELRQAARALAAAVDTRFEGMSTAMLALSGSVLLETDLRFAEFARRARPPAEALGGWVVVLDAPPRLWMLANTLAPERDYPLPHAYPAGTAEAIERAAAAAVATRGAAITSVVQSPLLDRPVVWLIRPIYPAGQGRLLAFGFEPRLLTELLDRQVRLERGHVAIADSAGNWVAFSHGVTPEAAGLPAPAVLARRSQAEGAPIVSSQAPDGRALLHVVKPLTQAPGWVLVLTEQLEAVEAGGRIALRWLMAAALLVVGGLAAGIWAVLRQRDATLKVRSAVERATLDAANRLHAGLPAVIHLRRVAPDGTDRFVYMAGDMEAVTGWTIEDFTAAGGRKALLPPGEPDPFDAVSRQFLHAPPGTPEQESAAFDWRLRRPEGGYAEIRTRLRVVRRLRDGSIEVAGHSLNIERERAAENAAIAAARLASLGELSTGLAHELKQPLTAIMVSTEVAKALIDKGDTARAQAKLDRVVEQVTRTVTLVDHLRRYGRGGGPDTAPEPVTLQEALAGALDIVGASLRDAGVTLDVALGTEAETKVLAHRLSVEQVLVNLLANARDAVTGLPRGTPRRVRITAGTDTAAGRVALRVGDTGGGIAPEMMSRLFVPFATTKGTEKGTGLGLSICRGLLEAMDGTIAAENGAEGAVFTVTLPLAPD